MEEFFFAMILRDSIDPNHIPLNGLSAVAGYGDGLYQWSSSGWARFPSSIVPLSIVVNPANRGDILDVESYDATPADTPGWADRFHRPGRRAPTIYCNRSTIGAVRAAMGSRPFDWWAATLDGTQNVPGAVAVQYAGSSITGANYDESVILDPTWIGAGGPLPMALRTLSLAVTTPNPGGFPDSGYGAVPVYPNVTDANALVVTWVGFNEPVPVVSGPTTGRQVGSSTDWYAVFVNGQHGWMAANSLQQS